MTNIFDESNRPARDIAGENWFKFLKIGDKVGGTIRDIFENPERDGYPAQRCFTLEKEDGEFINVGLKKTGYILTRTDNLQIGDKLGIKFEKEIPPSTKGFHPAKSLTIYAQMIGERTGVKAKEVVALKTEIGNVEEMKALSKDAEAGRPESGDIPF